MALLMKDTIEDDCLLGMWEINETFEHLYSKVKLSESEEIRLQSFKNEQRKSEWLSVRVLIKDLVKDDALIVYNADRKPFLSDRSHNISISHSRELTAILLSKNKKVGIDLEYMSHRIERIAHKFINEREYITSDPSLRSYHLYIHWCMKETLYKICDKQDINFKHNITIKPFDPNHEGTITGTVSNRFGVEDYNIHYYRYDNYVIAWCTK